MSDVTYRIAETAERSGFAPATLRYYEQIGLLPAATRTPGGYRQYSERDLERLRFIERAKHLGCTLGEIQALIGIWDEESCAPVQRRLHELVTSKLTAAERQITELTALVGQLQLAVSHLAGPASDGPCSADCACLALSGGFAPIELTTKSVAR
jgi:DNA-binding transcriptional MerR regulator